MADIQPIDDTKYAGPSKAIEVLGRGNAYGWIGSGVGLVGGGIVAALGTHKPNQWTEKATNLLNHFNIKLNGRWPIIAGGAFVGWQALHIVGLVIGLRVGATRAGEGHAQFERIKAKCDGLRTELGLLRENHQQQAEEISLLKQQVKMNEAQKDSAPEANVTATMHDGMTVTTTPAEFQAR